MLLVILSLILIPVIVGTFGLVVVSLPDDYEHSLWVYPSAVVATILFTIDITWYSHLVAVLK